VEVALGLRLHYQQREKVAFLKNPKLLALGDQLLGFAVLGTFFQSIYGSNILIAYHEKRGPFRDVISNIAASCCRQSRRFASGER
jgi:hypothetical protein